MASVILHRLPDLCSYSDIEDVMTKVVEAIRALEELALSKPKELQQNPALRRNLYDAVRKLVLEVETPSEMAQRLLYTPCEMMAAKIGVDLGVFASLNKSAAPQSTEDLAESTAAEPALLQRLLQFLAAVGLINEVKENVWGPNNATSNLADARMAAGINHKHDSVMPAWHALASWLKRHNYKSPASSVDTAFAQGHDAPPEQTFFEWLKQHPLNADQFNMFMGVHRIGAKSGVAAPAVLNLLKSSQGGTHNGVAVNGGLPMEGSSARLESAVFVDVGGGLGHQCKELRRCVSDLDTHILLQDLPEVIGKVSTEIHDLGIDTMPINFFKGQPVKGATVYYLRSILRDWPDAQATIILEHIHAAMSSSSYVLIDEIVLPDFGAGKEQTQLDMTMLAMLNGSARTVAQFKKLIDGAGLELVDRIRYSEETGEEVLVCRKKR
ncbi:S-adenosyl-L-methionine-dependent methyltransferase [Sporormia fimetaria CBS 119925]|uniref:S-adenosyl-L-methionine-dependent methyltransferase n=1 Tax=Sporormia fimetaria CBS 119925 TaxID=1340428 RepID=A0A6A6V1E3_9PLEO|nr:S-adenosyl-L-methionine-dependent methyltransferase [Sporormia fimetaria CBS 119925]